MVTDINLDVTTFTYQGMGIEKRHHAMSPSVTIDLGNVIGTLTTKLTDHEVVALRALFDQIEARVIDDLRKAE
jgi:hypothetical protein